MSLLWQADPILILVTEPHPRLDSIVAQAVAGGVDIVQWRDKGAAERPLPSTLRQAAWPARLTVNAPGSVAARLGADGRHLPESREVTVADARVALPAGSLIGRSAHSVTAAASAAQEGADYVIAGTIFASRSHPDLTPMGLDYLREVCQAVAIPVIAIGGIRPENVADCLSAGAAGVAVLSPIMLADDPRAAAAQYRRALDDASPQCHPPLSEGATEYRIAPSEAAPQSQPALGVAAAPPPRGVHQMTITVNGDERACEDGATIGSFLEGVRLSSKMVVVEYNGDIVARERYSEITLSEGDVLEIVQMMAGG